MKPRNASILKKVGIVISLFILLGIALFPLAIAIALSFRPSYEAYSVWHWIPNQFTIETWINALTLYNMTHFIMNSVYAATGSALLALLIAIPPSYAFARRRFKGKSVGFFMIVFAFLFPYVLLLIPINVILAQLNLTDTIPGLWFAFLTFTIPYSIWILTDFFSKLPRDIEEAALLDGLSYFGAFFRIVLPLAKPAIIAVFFLAFLYGWDDYMFPSVLTTEKTRTAVVNLYLFTTASGFTYWGELMASVVLISLPPVILYALLQRFIVRGLAITVSE
ncbi:Inner membrane ABC transporter permease protein YcjP [archaeon HR06]|nr:Inner membrane ABC transporter permease protein YcjP [archaeon HR06]